MKIWRLIPYQMANAAMNMAIDEAILKAIEKGESPPTARFYGWIRPSVSLGFSQKPDSVNLDECKRLGVPVVSRITGGRAVLHHQELTYSIASTLDYDLFSGSLKDSFIKIHRSLFKALEKLRIPLDQMANDKSKSGTNSANCFAFILHGSLQ